MQHYQDVLLDRSGNAIAGATITVTNHLDGLPAILYADYAGTIVLTSIVTDSDGSYSFYVSSGRYDFKFYKYGLLLKTQSDVFIDQSTALQDLSALSGASMVGFAPTGTISSTTVQTAIAELGTEKVQLTALAATTGASLVGFQQTGTGAVARTVDAKLKETVSVKDFGAVGDGVTDDTTTIQNAINASVGKILLFQDGLTYKYTQLTILSNVTVVANRSTFSRITASTSHGFVIDNNVNIDSLAIITPGGATGDKGILIKGSDVSIDNLSITALAQGVYNSVNYALEIESIPSGTKLRNININYFYSKYFSAAMFVKNVELMTVNKALVEYYRTAIYLRDTSVSVFNNVTCQYTASTSYGVAGENGLLVESTLSSGSSFDLKFNGWTVSNSGEHAYRLGGAYTIRDVWFEDCRAIASGSSIVVNNPAATVWNGGCGFKVLGATSVTDQKHYNIYYNNCTVEDVNETYGAFPTGHGEGNYSGFQAAVCSNVHISNCSVQRKNNSTTSCSFAVELLAADHVYISDCSFINIRKSIRIYEAGAVGTYPGWDFPCTYIYFNNTYVNTISTGEVFLLGDGAQNYAHSNIYLNRCHLEGGNYASRLVPITGTGSYANIYFDFDYTGCLANLDTATTPVIYGTNGNDVIMGTIRAPWIATAYGPQMKDGTVWQDTYKGSYYIRAFSTWRRISTTNMFSDSTTSTSLQSATNAINTTDKISGKLIWNGTLSKLFRANGTTATSTWTAVDNSSTITPV